MNYGLPFLQYQLQTYVDATYAELGVCNRGAARCMVRRDTKRRGCYWVRVHGTCADPEAFAAGLRRVALTSIVKQVELSGSKNYVKIWPNPSWRGCGERRAMKFGDLQTIERFAAEFCREHSVGRIPVTLSTEYDRVDVDLSCCRLHANLVQDYLAQRMGRLGYLYDFWYPDGEPHRTLCVSEKTSDE